MWMHSAFQSASVKHSSCLTAETKFVLHRGSMTFISGVDVVLTYFWRRPDRMFAVLHKHNLYWQVPAVQRPGKAAGDAAGALWRVGQLLLPVPARRRPGRAVGHGLGAFAPAFVTLPWHSRVVSLSLGGFGSLTPQLQSAAHAFSSVLSRLAHPCVVCGMLRLECSCLIDLLKTQCVQILLSPPAGGPCVVRILQRGPGAVGARRPLRGRLGPPAALRGALELGIHAVSWWLKVACNGRTCARDTCPLAKQQSQVFRCV